MPSVFSRTACLFMLYSLFARGRASSSQRGTGSWLNLSKIKKSYRPCDLILSRSVRRWRYRTFNRIPRDSIGWVLFRSAERIIDGVRDRIIWKTLDFLNRGKQVGIHPKGSLIPSAVLGERKRAANIVAQINRLKRGRVIMREHRQQPIRDRAVDKKTARQSERTP